MTRSLCHALRQGDRWGGCQGNIDLGGEKDVSDCFPHFLHRSKCLCSEPSLEDSCCPPSLVLLLIPSQCHCFPVLGQRPLLFSCSPSQDPSLFLAEVLQAAELPWPYSSVSKSFLGSGVHGAPPGISDFACYGSEFPVPSIAASLCMAFPFQAPLNGSISDVF